MKSTNLLGSLVIVTFPTGGSELAVTHGLIGAAEQPITPRGFIVTRISQAASVYVSGTAWTNTTAYLKCSVSGTVCFILFFV